MPAYQIQVLKIPEQGLTKEEREELHAELCACTEVVSTIRNSVEHYMVEAGIGHIEELDYSYRLEYENWLDESLTYGTRIKYLTGFDWIKRHSIREKRKTILGRNRKILYESKVWFLPYYPDQEIAARFDKAAKKNLLVWDFSRDASERMKSQIFTALQRIITSDYVRDYRLVKMNSLRRFYDFCAEREIQDIEYLELEDEAQFRQYLIELKAAPTDIINYCRETVFIEARETNWNANVWYFSRFHFEKERVNPSNTICRVSFQNVQHQENRKLLQHYMKYGVGLSTLSLSSLKDEFHYLQEFLAYFNDTSYDDAKRMTGKEIDSFFKHVEQKKLRPNTFNRYVKAVNHFYQYLLTRHLVRKIPFYQEYYLKAEIYKHNDRSVDEETCREILANLQYFPEEIRLMYLHLWGVGMRISEVCTIKANAYYKQGQDIWMQIYQVKMRNYKRIPIPAALYKLVQVYIRKHDRKPDEYVFQDSKGGAYKSATFRDHMKRYCKKYNIAGGTYLFQSHGYRHTLATVFYDSGVPLQSVRDYLGHAYEEMTQQYIDYMPRRIDDASRKFFQKPDNSLASGLKERWKHGRKDISKDAGLLPESD